MDVIALRRRWNDHAALTAEVLGRLAGGLPLDGMPLDRVDGRWDLRGLVAPTPRASQSKQYRVTGPVDLSYNFVTLEGTLEFKDVTLENLDFSGAGLTHLRLFNSTIINSRFDEADCRDLRMWATEFRDCTFVGANLFDSNIGAFHDGRPNRMQQVDFTRADLTKLSCGVADFVDCNFSHAKVKDINFWQASLIRCRFAGELRNVIFDGRILEPDKKATPNPFEDVDMTEATFDGVDFRGVKFDRIRLPDDPNIIVIRSPEWLDEAMARLGDRDDRAARIVRGRLENKVKFDRPNGGQLFVNLSGIQDPDARQLMRELISGITH